MCDTEEKITQYWTHYQQLGFTKAKESMMLKN